MDINTSAQEPALTKKLLPIILATAIFMQMLDSTILNTSLPAIAKELNESPLNMQNAIIGYVLTLALFMSVSGFLSDKFGTKNVFIFVLVLFSVGSLSQNLNSGWLISPMAVTAIFGKSVVIKIFTPLLFNL